MIGDNLETDITFSKNGGIDGLCVLTGVATEKMVQDSGIATYYSEYLLWLLCKITNFCLQASNNK